jgi:hypothetical protein
MLKNINNNRGIALPVVIIMIAVIFLFCATVLTLSDTLTKNVSRTIELENALQIAEAGYNQYLFYLNNNSAIFKSVTASEEAGFDVEAVDADGLPLVYAPVPYSSGGTVVGYYKISITQPGVNRDLTVTCTGWTAENPNIRRTVQVEVHKRSFAEYVDLCASQGDVKWTTGNIAEGPIYCNDSVYIKGSPLFKDNIYTHKKVVVESGNPTFQGNIYEYVPEMAFPATNSQMREWAINGGILLTGRTCILLKNNKLLIRNKNTNGDAAYETDIPASGVIYVEGGDLFISGTLDGRLTIYATENIYITGKDPTNYTPNRSNDPDDSQYCTYNGYHGIFYADKNLPGKNDTGTNFSDDMLGMISEKKIYVATKTWPSSSGTTTYQYSSVAVNNIAVYGALMTNRSTGGICVEDYDKAPVLGIFTVKGSKIQNSVRGAVGTFNSNTLEMVSGYSKQDSFDYRLRTESPPHFVEPVNSGWELKVWREVRNP